MWDHDQKRPSSHWAQVGRERAAGATKIDSRDSTDSLEPRAGRVTNFDLGVDRKELSSREHPRNSISERYSKYTVLTEGRFYTGRWRCAAKRFLWL